MKQTMGGITAALALIVFQSAAQTTATKNEFSAKQCIEYAKNNNVQVKNALLGVQVQEQVNRQYTAAAYPQINGSVGSSYFPNIGVQSFPNFIAAATYGVLEAEGVQNGNGVPIKSPSDFGFIQAAFGTKWVASAGVSLQQILFDGQVFVGLQARKTALDFSMKNYDVTEEGIRTNIYKVYYQLVISKVQMQQIDANITRTEKLLHDAGELYKNGFAEKLDVDRTNVQLINLQTEKSNLQNIISNGYLGLKVLIGMPVKDTLILTDTVTEDNLKEGLLNEGMYQYTDRQDYQYLQIAKKLGDYNIRRYKLSKLPSVNLSSGFSKLAQRNTFSFFGKGDWFSSSNISLNINVPIFDGNFKTAKMKQAQIENEQTANQIAGLEMAIDNEVATATNNYRNAIASLDFQMKNKELAEEVYNQTKKKYESGLGSTLDIANAEADLKTAEGNYISAMYTSVIAKIDYLKAIGKLP